MNTPFEVEQSLGLSLIADLSLVLGPEILDGHTEVVPIPRPPQALDVVFSITSPVRTEQTLLLPIGGTGFALANLATNPITQAAYGQAVIIAGDGSLRVSAIGPNGRTDALRPNGTPLDDLRGIAIGVFGFGDYQRITLVRLKEVADESLTLEVLKGDVDYPPVEVALDETISLTLRLLG